MADPPLLEGFTLDQQDSAPPPGFTLDDHSGDQSRAAPVHPNDDAPIIITAIRPPGAPRPGQEISPSYTEAGFGLSDGHYHSELSAADKAEYAHFFADRNKPPTPAALQIWYHQKTGALLSNAQGIVDAFKKSGKFSTNEQIVIPVKHQSGPAAAIEHVADAVVGDFGPEAGAALSAIPDAAAHAVGLGGDNSVGQDWANNADATRAQLNQDSADHPYWSVGGELTGAGLAALATGKLMAGTDVAGLPSGFKAAGGGAVYGAGAAGPGNRGAGAVSGAALGAATDFAAPYVLKAITPAVKAIPDATKTVAQAAQDLGIDLPRFVVGGTKDAKRAAALEQTAFGAKPISDATGTMLDQSADAKAAIASSVGEAVDEPANLGDQVLSAGSGAAKALRAKGTQLYNQARAAVGSAAVAPKDTLSTIDTLLADESQKIGGSKIAPILQRMRDDLQSAGTITVQQARDLRTTLRETLGADAGATPDNADRITKAVMAGVNSDMKASLPDSAYSLFQKADANWAQQRQLEDDVLKPFLGKNYDNWGEDVAKRINTDAKGNGTRLARLLSALPDEDANRVRASLIMGLGRGRDGAQNAAGDAFSLDTFLTNWNQLKGSRNLIFPKDAVESLDKLAKVAEVAKGYGRNRNFSNTGNVMSALLHGAPTTLGLIGSGMTHDPRDVVLGIAASAFTAIRQRSAAKLLASPAFAKRLAATPMNAKAAASFWNRPWVQKLQLQNPAIAGEIRAFQGAFLSHANDNSLVTAASAQPNSEDQQ